MMTNLSKFIFATIAIALLASFTLYSTDGVIVQEIPFLMLYDEDYAPVL